MKKTMGKILALMMIFTMVFSFNLPGFAEGETDTTTSATTTTTKYENTTPAAYNNIVVPEGAEVYWVKAGDAIWKVAKAHNLTIDELLALNPVVKNKNMIYIGQKLIVKMAKTETAQVVTPAPATTALYHGIGQYSNLRARGTNYSMNIAMASVIFDEAGKIVDCYIDTYEISQANFPGWPGTTEELTFESVSANVSDWKTKRERGDSYGMAKSATTGLEWYTQLNNYQEWFKGKTVAELRVWFDKNTGATGKPINAATTTNEAELAKLAALTDAEKAELVDVITSATMSLSDAHSLILESVEEAYTNRVLIK